MPQILLASNVPGCMQHVKSCHECQIKNTAKAHLPITTSPPSTVFIKVHIDIHIWCVSVEDYRTSRNIMSKQEHVSDTIESDRRQRLSADKNKMVSSNE